MQHANVIVMPMPNPNRKPPLRREENPPYPPFAIDMLREFSKAISEEISPIREDIGVMKYAMNSLESQLRNHGEKLEAVVVMKHTITALETASDKQGNRIGKIEGHVHTVKAILWVLSGFAGFIAVTVGVVELSKYFK